MDRKTGSEVAPSAGAPLVRSSRLDLHEDTEKNVVTATFELHGFTTDEVQINFQNGKLSVSAESKIKSEDHSGYTLNERKFSLQLPPGVQGEQIEASMENGFLIVTFPRPLPEPAPKKIEIQASDKED